LGDLGINRSVNFIEFVQGLGHLWAPMPNPKFQITKERPGRYRINIPRSLSTDRPRRRRRRFFSTLEEAEEFVRSFKSQLRDLGTSFRILKPLDSADADDAIKALRRHAIKHGMRRPRLRDIVDEWIDHWNEQNRSVSLRHLFDLYLETRKHDSLKHQQSLRYTKERFQKLHTRKVSTLTKDDIDDALWKLPPTSFNAHLRRTRSVLTYGVKHGYLTKNPALLVESIKRPRQSVKILPVETVELMLRTAQMHTPDLLPFLCVSLFTGVRREETSKLLWDDFNLPDKKLIVRAEISKTNQHRPIDLSDNLIAWLETFNRRHGRRVMAGFTIATLANSRSRLWEHMRLTDSSLPKHPPHNVLRHCYVSHYLSLHGPESIWSLTIQAGHTSQVMFRHYLNIVSKADAERYWNIRP
jgi:site-specific recombinase XerD